MKLINLTKHTVNLFNNGEIISIPPSEKHEPIRITTHQKAITHIDGIPVMQTVYSQSEVTGGRLPDPKPNTMYIVSSLVCMAYSDRRDLVSPNTHPDATVRDGVGNLMGVTSLQSFYRRN
jgi:hypothetical protein